MLAPPAPVVWKEVTAKISVPAAEQENWERYLSEMAAGFKIAAGSKNPECIRVAARNVLLCESLARMNSPRGGLMMSLSKELGSSYKSLPTSSLDSLLMRVDPQPGIFDKFTTEAIACHGGKVWVGLGSGCVAVLDAATWQVESPLFLHRSRITTLRIAGNCLWSGALDTTVHVLDAKTRQAITVLDQHSDGVVGMVVVRGGAEVWTASINGEVFIWNTLSHELIERIELPKKAFVGCLGAVRLDGDSDRDLPPIEHVWVCTSLGVLVFDVATRAQVKHITEGPRPVSCMTEAGGMVWTSSSRLEMRGIHIWDARSFELVRTWNIESGGFNALLATQGKVIGGAGNGGVYVWDAETHCYLAVLQGHTDSVRSLCGLPNGLVLSGPGSRDGRIYVWNVAFR